MIADYLQSDIIKFMFNEIRHYSSSCKLSELIALSNGKSMTKAKMILDSKIPVYGG